MRKIRLSKEFSLRQAHPEQAGRYASCLMYTVRVSASIAMWKAAITTTNRIFVPLNPFRFQPNPAAAPASQMKACAPAIKAAVSKDRLCVQPGKAVLCQAVRLFTCGIAFFAIHFS